MDKKIEYELLSCEILADIQYKCMLLQIASYTSLWTSRPHEAQVYFT